MATYVSEAMQCVADTAAAAKRAASDNTGTAFGVKCAVLGMAADMVLGDMTVQDFLDIVIAEVQPLVS
jgi:hypothetical protein